MDARFAHILLARWLGVAPWELEAAPTEWCDWAAVLKSTIDEVTPILAEREALRRKGEP